MFITKLMANEKPTEEEKKDFWTGFNSVASKVAPLTGVGGLLAYTTATGDKDAAYEFTGASLAAVGVACLLLDAKGGTPLIPGVV